MAIILLVFIWTSLDDSNSNGLLWSPKFVRTDGPLKV